MPLAAVRFGMGGRKILLTLNYTGPVSGNFSFTSGAVFTLTTPGTYTFTWSRSAIVAGLFVGGGGGGGGSYENDSSSGTWYGGKGGAGGFYESGGLAVSGSMTVTVGAGGAPSTQDGADGGATGWSGINCNGGGGGGSGWRHNVYVGRPGHSVNYASGGGGGGGPTGAARGEGGPTGWGNPGEVGQGNPGGDANGGAGGGAGTTAQGSGLGGQGRTSAFFGGVYCKGGPNPVTYGDGGSTGGAGMGGLIKLILNE